MFNIALQFLLDIFVQGFAGLLLARFLLQWLRAPLRNPMGEALMSLTNFAVLPARRYIPSAWQLDSATWLLALGVEMIYLMLQLLLQDYPYAHFPLLALLIWSLVKLLSMSLYLLMSALVAQAVLSWVNPHTPLAPLLHAITARFLQPIRRLVPLLGNVDLSSFILLVICQLLVFVPVAILENLAVRML